MSKSGSFVVGSMPIGNSEDITVRMINAIKSASLIICENYSFFNNFINTLNIKINSDILEFTGEMANMPGITEQELLIKDKIINSLKTGDMVLYISDEGLPGINDPGSKFIKFVSDYNYNIDVLPGPSVSTTAFLHSLAFSSTTSFSFMMLEDNLNHKLPFLKNMLSFQNIVFTTNPSTFNEETILKIIEFIGDRDVVVCHCLTTPNQKITKAKLSQSLKYVDYGNGPATVVILADEWR